MSVRVLACLWLGGCLGVLKVEWAGVSEGLRVCWWMLCVVCGWVYVCFVCVCVCFIYFSFFFSFLFSFHFFFP